MKRTVLVCLTMMTMMSLKAQDEDQTEFTDAELISYATVMVWAESEKDKMTEQYNSWIRDNEDIASAKFSELKEAEKNETMDEVEATEEELAAYQVIQAKNEEQLAAFKETYISKIKEDITVGLYNDLNKALKKDAVLKDRYSKIFDELLQAITADTEEETKEKVESGS